MVYELKVASMRDYVDAVYGWDDAVQKVFFDKDFRPKDITIITANGLDAGMFEIENKDDGYFLRRIEVYPTFQNHGIGSKIIRDIMLQASSEDKKVSLLVFCINPAWKLYERLGFEIVEETDTHYRMVWQNQANPADAKKPRG
jgi:ribosomal protein S18 acetylase RimI-like enzyme